MIIRVMKTSVMRTRWRPRYDNRLTMRVRPQRPGCAQRRARREDGETNGRSHAECNRRDAAAWFLPAHRRRDGTGARGACARSVARAGHSGTAGRTGLAGAAEGTPSSTGGRIRDQQGRAAGIRPYVPGDKRTANRERRRGDSRRRPAPRRVPARARGRDVAQIQNRGIVQDRRSGDQSARTQESVPALEVGRAARTAWRSTCSSQAAPCSAPATSRCCSRARCSPAMPA